MLGNVFMQCIGMLISVPGDHLGAVQTLVIITKHFLTQYFVRHCSPLCLVRADQPIAGEES